MDTKLTFPLPIRALQFCASIAVNNVNENGTIQASLDVKFNDGSYLLDQSLSFPTGTHDFQRKCIAVEGINLIDSFVVLLISDNKPDPLPSSVSRMDSFDLMEASWIKVKDISIRELSLPITSEILNHTQLSKDVPIRFDSFSVEPYFFQSEYEPDLESDVTYVTQLSVDRLDRLLLVAEKFRGPISASVYIKRPEEKDQVISSLKIHALLRRYVDFHLLYQFDHDVIWTNIFDHLLNF